MVDLTISLINGGNKDLILACIESVYKTAGGLNIEVIVVDNMSADGSVEAIKERFPYVRLIINDKKEGFSANNNKAVKSASGSLFMLLNDDTVLHTGALPAMAGLLRSNPEAGAVGGFLMNPDGSPQYTGKARPTLLAAAMISLGIHRILPDNPVTAAYYHRNNAGKGAEEVESISGAALMVKMDVISKVGPLDEGFFLFCEDVDWCIRMREAGYKLYALPEARITHLRGASTGGRRMVWVYHKSLFRFYRKHYAPGRFFLVNWLMYLALAARLLVYLVYGRVRKS